MLLDDCPTEFPRACFIEPHAGIVRPHGSLSRQFPLYNNSPQTRSECLKAMADALPKGWKSAKSTRHPGQVYYYHKFAEATWDRPSPSTPAPKASRRVRLKTALKPARCPPSPVGDCKRPSVQEYYGPQSLIASTTFTPGALIKTGSYDYIYDRPSHNFSGYSTSYSSTSYEMSTPYRDQSASRWQPLWTANRICTGLFFVLMFIARMLSRAHSR